MGNAGSSNATDMVPTAPVTINRIRDVCQRTKDMESNKWKVDLLANDISKQMGITVKTEINGRKRTSQQICQDIRMSLPNPEKVCMAGTGKVRDKGKKGVLKAVELYNNNFGANIQIYKNPLFPEQGKRNVAELCDDLYYVSDTIMRQLKDNHAMVKNSLDEEIQRLTVQYGMLKTMFNSVDQSSMGNPVKLDQVVKDQEEVTAAAAAYNAMIEQDLAKLQQERVNWAALSSKARPVTMLAQDAAMALANQQFVDPLGQVTVTDVKVDNGQSGGSTLVTDDLSMDVANNAANFVASSAEVAEMYINGCINIEKVLQAQKIQNSELKDRVLREMLSKRREQNVKMSKLSNKAPQTVEANNMQTQLLERLRKSNEALTNSDPLSNIDTTTLNSTIARTQGCFNVIEPEKNCNNTKWEESGQEKSCELDPTEKVCVEKSDQRGGRRRKHSRKSRSKSTKRSGRTRGRR
jgi:hypothetical protein